MSPSSVPSRDQRNFGLDILRSAAILAVLAFHGYLGFGVATGLSAWHGWRAAFSASAGVLSLEWFFVLSGFLIGSILIRGFETGDGWWPSVRTFWLRRWFRTLPNYYLFLALNVLLAWWHIEPGRFAWPFLLFLQSFAWTQEKPFFFAESWSLAVEEWFYFIIPCLLGVVAVSTRLSRRGLFCVVATLFILVPTLLRMAAPAATHFFEWDESTRRVTLLHLDSIGWGLAAAIVSRWHPRAWSRHPGCKALLGLALTLVHLAAMYWFMVVDWRGFAGGRFNDLVLISAPAAGTALLLPWLSRCRAPVPALRSWMARLADYSYSMYLCHFPLMLLMLHVIKVRAWDVGSVLWLAVVLWLATVCGLSALIFHRFERPVTNLRDRFTARVRAGPFDATTASRAPRS